MKASLWCMWVCLVACHQVLFGDWFGYVTNTEDSSVSKIDLNTNTFISALELDNPWPASVAITPDAQKAFVAHAASSEETLSFVVTPIDLTTFTAQTPLQIQDVQSSHTSIGITPNGKTVYVNYLVENANEGMVFPIDVATNVVGAGIPVHGVPLSIAITPDSTKAYVGGHVNNAPVTISVIDLATNTVVDTFQAGSDDTDVLSMAITPDGAMLYLTDATYDQVIPVATSNNQPQTPIPVGSFPAGIAITSDGTKAYVTNHGASTVTPIVLATKTPGAVIDLGGTPIDLAITPDGKTAFVSIQNQDGNTITSIDTATDTANPQPISVESAPYGVAITPDQPPTALFESSTSKSRNTKAKSFEVTVVFDATSSSSPEGTIALYTWSFGDGESIQTDSPSVTHTYRESGIFDVTLTVTNTAGTSVGQTFTGRTLSNSGGPQARITNQVIIQSNHVSRPNHFSGKVKQEKHSGHTRFTLKTKWHKSPTFDVDHYDIYAYKRKIGTVSSSGHLRFSKYIYPHHMGSKKVPSKVRHYLYNKYKIRAVSTSGDTSRFVHVEVDHHIH